METPNLNRGYFFMVCLALQFGCQPLSTKAFVDPGAHKPTLVLLCEVLKAIFAIVLFCVDGDATARRRALKNWSLLQTVTFAGVPAAVYAFQNIMIQIAYQNTDPLLFNLLNQTKIVFTAAMVYVLMGKTQSFGQCVALAMLVAVGVLLSLPEDATDLLKVGTGNDFMNGIVPCLVACVCSGFASAYSQKVMSGTTKRNAYLFSAELSVCSSLVLVASNSYSLFGRGGGAGFASSFNFLDLRGLTMMTLIPLVTNASGGIFVGQVTKHAGSVRKVFCVVGGIFTTAIVRLLLFDDPVNPKIFACIPVVLFSLILYNRSATRQKAKTA
eukprot:g3473.t1